MTAPAIPRREPERLAALARYEILDTMPEDAFDELARLASVICRTPIALVSLVDVSRQWFKARIGIDATETPRDISFCGHAIHESDVFVVPDALEDVRFATNPLVTGEPNIRFYAGAQLTTPGGENLGTLCVIDRQPRRLDDEQRAALRTLARQVIVQLELRRKLREQQHVEEALRAERDALERLKSNFVSTVSHELRTPLTSIRGSLGLLSSGVLGELSAEAKQMVTVAERNSVRLITLINDILDFEKLESGKVEMDLQPVPLQRVLERSIESISAFAVQEGIGLELHGAEATVLADETRLIQVIVNLLSNAVKHSSRGGAVTLRATLDGRSVDVRVEDRGTGIPEAAQRKLFERFHQLDAGDSRSKPGTGLGLAICKSIVEQHGGTIGLSSREGEGSTFWFCIPRVLSPGEEAGVPRAGLDVVIIEDDAELLDVMAAQLGADGVHVRTARSGWSGLAAIGERTPGLIVLDVDLPDLDGFGVVSELRNHASQRNLPLLVYTAMDLTMAQRNRLQLGPTRFLMKSRSSDTEFRSAVGQLLDHARARELA